MALHEHYQFAHSGDPTDALIDLFWVNTIDYDPKYYRSTVVETEESPLDKIKALHPEWRVETKWHHSSGGAFQGRLLKIQVDEGDNKAIVWLAYFTGSSKRCNMRLVSQHEAAVETIFEICSKLEPIEAVIGNKVKVTFWWKGSFPQSRPRHLDIVKWDEIRQNYSATAVDEIDSLIHFKPELEFVGGKLALFHGPAGTGKTTLIRAVAKEWSDWCNIEYVTDPERFFGDASYMIQVLMDEDDTPKYGHAAEEDPRWRLVVLEDSGEFLQKTKDDSVTQSLSRLLNLSDGLMGQGLRVMSLLTTNQQIHEVHPAITRPGRCLANISVPKLTKTEALKWLGPEWKGVIDEEKTIAELYLEKTGDEHITTKVTPVQTGTYL